MYNESNFNQRQPLKCICGGTNMLLAPKPHLILGQWCNGKKAKYTQQ